VGVRVGDRIAILGRSDDRPLRQGEVREVRGADGEPPYLVRWDATGRETLFVPGPGA
jgi:hypothetical protein